MIKVDVEGYEADIFRGAQSVIYSPLLKAVIAEGQRPADIALLLKAGFEQYEYDPFQRMLQAMRQPMPETEGFQDRMPLLRLAGCDVI